MNEKVGDDHQDDFRVGQLPADGVSLIDLDGE
jgi:hypothetical protein